MSSQEMFCRTASCEGFWGFEVRWNEGNSTCPPYPEIDYCPHCGMDIHERQLDYETPIYALLEALDESDTGIDPHPLLEVIQAELERQRRVLAARLKSAPALVYGPETECPV